MYGAISEGVHGRFSKEVLRNIFGVIDRGINNSMPKEISEEILRRFSKKNLCTNQWKTILNDSPKEFMREFSRDIYNIIELMEESVEDFVIKSLEKFSKDVVEHFPKEKQKGFPKKSLKDILNESRDELLFK